VSKSTKRTKNLLSDTEVIALVITLRKIPEKRKTKPQLMFVFFFVSFSVLSTSQSFDGYYHDSLSALFRFTVSSPLPHPLFDDSVEICIISPDPGVRLSLSLSISISLLLFVILESLIGNQSKYKTLFQANPVPGVKKVFSLFLSLSLSFSFCVPRIAFIRFMPSSVFLFQEFSAGAFAVKVAGKLQAVRGETAPVRVVRSLPRGQAHPLLPAGSPRPLFLREEKVLVFSS
jgi:hypothetical protein